MDVWPPPGGIVEQLSQRPTFFASELANEIDRLTPEYLEFFALLSALSKWTTGKEFFPEFIAYGVATYILRFFLGEDWTNENVFGIGKGVASEHRDGRQFLRAGFVDASGDDLLHFTRVVTLADCFYNLQDVPGMEFRRGLLKADSLEAAFGELECAKLVAAPALKLRFVIPKGQKRSDYDLEIDTPAGHVLCCEIKTKVETSEASFATIRNTLETARKQLPKGGPGIIFLKVPGNWASQLDASEFVNAAIARALRVSERLVAIVIVWNEVGRHGEQRFACRKFQRVANEKSPLWTPDIGQAIASFGTQLNRDWWSIEDHANGLHPVLVAYLSQPPIDDLDPDRCP